MGSFLGLVPSIWRKNLFASFWFQKNLETQISLYWLKNKSDYVNILIRQRRMKNLVPRTILSYVGPIKNLFIDQFQLPGYLDLRKDAWWVVCTAHDSVVSFRCCGSHERQSWPPRSDGDGARRPLCKDRVDIQRDKLLQWDPSQGEGQLCFLKMLTIALWRRKVTAMLTNTNTNEMRCSKVIGLCSNKPSENVRLLEEANLSVININ